MRLSKTSSNGRRRWKRCIAKRHNVVKQRSNCWFEQFVVDAFAQTTDISNGAHPLLPAHPIRPNNELECFSICFARFIYFRWRLFFPLFFRPAHSPTSTPTTQHQYLTHRTLFVPPLKNETSNIIDSIGGKHVLNIQPQNVHADAETIRFRSNAVAARNHCSIHASMRLHCVRAVQRNETLFVGTEGHSKQFHPKREHPTSTHLSFDHRIDWPFMQMSKYFTARLFMASRWLCKKLKKPQRCDYCRP